MMCGWIRLNRSILDWEWYDDPATKSVFLHLLLMANYQPSSYRGVHLNEGQAVFGRKALAEKLGLTERQVRTALQHLEKTGELTIKTTNKFSIATIEKWGFYQGCSEENDQQIDQQLTNKRPHSRNKEVNKFIPPTVEEVRSYCQARGNSIDPEAFIDYYSSKGWVVGKNKMKDWKAAVRNWERRQKAEEPQVEKYHFD